MGQMIAVKEKPSTSPGVVRYELNRSLTGMGHVRFASVDDAYGNTPPDVLARRLFATGQVAMVHVYANMVTVDLNKGQGADGLAEIIRELYHFWKPGVEPPTFEDLVADEPAAAAASSDGGGGDTGLSEAVKRVPAHLLERSRAGRERWNAKTA